MLLVSLLLAAALCAGCRTAGTAAATAGTGAGSVSPALPSRFLVKLWQVPVMFDRARVATLAGDSLYLAGTPRGIMAIDTATGLPRWRQSGSYVVDADVTLCGTALVYSEGGRLVSRDAKTGEELHRVKTRLGIISPVYATENSWVFAAGSDQLYGVTPGSGLRTGHVTMDAAALASTWDGKDTAYFLTTSGSLYAVSVSTQSITWQCKFRKPFCSAPALSHDMIFVGCQDYFLYAIDAESGLAMWQVPVEAPALETPVAAHGIVYVRTTDGILHAIEIATQKELWRMANGGQALTATKDRLILVRREADGNIVMVVNPADGSVLATATALRAEMFRADPESGIFYAVAANGETVAIAEKSVADALQAAKQ